MGINNSGANSVYLGLHTQSSNNMCNGIDVFSTSTPTSGFYVAENGSDFYVAENGSDSYVTES